MIKTRSDNEADKSATQSASYCPLIDQVKYFCYTVYGIFFYFNELKILRQPGYFIF